MSSMNRSMAGSTSTLLPQPVKLEGYLRKLKTMKKKYFVVFGDAAEKAGTSRLEYYDSEKKFKTAMAKSDGRGKVLNKIDV